MLGTRAVHGARAARGEARRSPRRLSSRSARLLYEMLTGKRAFEGASQASVIASILKEDPRPVSQLVPTTPASLDRVVTSCLAEGPRRALAERRRSRPRAAVDRRRHGHRDRSIRRPRGSLHARRAQSARVAWTLAALATIAAIAVHRSARHAQAARRHAQRTFSRFSIGSPAGATLTSDGVNSRISPDGRTLAFIASSSTGTASIWIRPLDSLTARPAARNGRRDSHVLVTGQPVSRVLRERQAHEGPRLGREPRGDLQRRRRTGRHVGHRWGDRLRPRIRGAALQRSRQRRRSGSGDRARRGAQGDGAPLALLPPRRKAFPVRRASRRSRGASTSSWARSNPRNASSCSRPAARRSTPTQVS